MVKILQETKKVIVFNAGVASISVNANINHPANCIKINRAGYLVYDTGTGFVNTPIKLSALSLIPVDIDLYLPQHESGGFIISSSDLISANELSFRIKKSDISNFNASINWGNYNVGTLLLEFTFALLSDG